MTRIQRFGLGVSLILAVCSPAGLSAAAPAPPPKPRIELSPALAPLIQRRDGKVYVKGGSEISALRHFDVEIRAAEIDLKKPAPAQPPVLWMQIKLKREHVASSAFSVPGRVPPFFPHSEFDFRLRIGGTQEAYQGSLNGLLWGKSGADRQPPQPAEWEASRVDALNKLDKCLQDFIARHLVRGARPQEQAGLYLVNPYPFPVAGIVRMHYQKGGSEQLSFHLPAGGKRRLDHGRHEFLQLRLNPPPATRE